jgi:hypothetical protein
LSNQPPEFRSSENRLTFLYIVTFSVSVVEMEAYKWLSLAEEGGYKDTQHALELLKPQMTSEQIAEAQRLANTWNTAHPHPKSN